MRVAKIASVVQRLLGRKIRRTRRKNLGARRSSGQVPPVKIKVSVLLLLVVRRRRYSADHVRHGVVSHGRPVETLALLLRTFAPLRLIELETRLHLARALLLQVLNNAHRVASAAQILQVHLTRVEVRLLALGLLSQIVRLSQVPSWCCEIRSWELSILPTKLKTNQNKNSF